MMNDFLTWYLVGAGLWMFATGIGYAFAGAEDRRGLARAFFGFPVWPATLVYVAMVGGMKLWKSTGWTTK